jgi:hypothetical protein
MKDYLLLILTACAPENGFAQDAIEWAIVSNHITLTYHPAHDVMTIMGLYDKIIDGYRSARQDADLLPVFADNIREAA